MNLDTCFVCGEPVLEVQGEYERYASYLLKDGEEAIAARAYGAVHASCIASSKWGAFWARRRVEHAREVLGMSVVASDARTSVLSNSNTFELWAIRDDGRSWSLPRGQLKRAQTVAGGVVLSVKEEWNLELDETQKTVAETVRKKLASDGRYPFLDLLRAVGWTGRLLDAKRLETSMLLFDKSLAKAQRGTWISAQLVYDRFIPEDIAALCRTETM